MISVLHAGLLPALGSVFSLRLSLDVCETDIGVITSHVRLRVGTLCTRVDVAYHTAKARMSFSSHDAVHNHPGAYGMFSMQIEIMPLPLPGARHESLISVGSTGLHHCAI